MDELGTENEQCERAVYAECDVGWLGYRRIRCIVSAAEREREGAVHWQQQQQQQLVSA